ncbi:tyrosine-type recombinase/integrase [Thermodesulfobacteriota bacterium]
MEMGYWLAKMRGGTGEVVRVSWCVSGHGRIKDIKKAITTAYKQAGIDPQGQPIHILRHTFATNMIMKGTELEKMQQLLGHKDFKTTLQYTHSTPRSVKDEVNKLD